MPAIPLPPSSFLYEAFTSLSLSKPSYGKLPASSLLSKTQSLGFLCHHCLPPEVPISPYSPHSSIPLKTPIFISSDWDKIRSFTLQSPYSTLYIPPPIHQPILQSSQDPKTAKKKKKKKEERAVVVEEEEEMSGPSLKLSSRTAIFGLRLWVLVGVACGVAFVLVLFLRSLWLASRRSKSHARLHPAAANPTIPEVRLDLQRRSLPPPPPPLLPPPPESEASSAERLALFVPPLDNESPLGRRGKEHRIAYPGSGGGSSYGSGDQAQAQPPAVLPEVSHLGWGHWYTLRELEDATDMFADENVIGEGGFGIVYHGVLPDNTHVAVKKLVNNRGQAEREFKVEVEAIGRVRHKNLVRLLGYCVEGAHRMLVYEYVDNGNLEQWLHGDVGPCSPLSWEIRMKIILGTAKGLLYLHDGLEPKVVHRDIKSSNILLDKKWNPKVSDFGLAKLLGGERTYVTTRVMGTFGYVAPEYASTGMLNERSDVYSFGILIMEVISGRTPVDYSRPPGEVNLVDWLKAMVSSRNSEGVPDPKMPEKPSSRALKRALLVALRCVDPDSQNRPKMGHILHMLEVDDFPYPDDRRAGRDRDPGRTHRDSPQAKAGLMEKPVADLGDISDHDSSTHADRPPKVEKARGIEDHS